MPSPASDASHAVFLQSLTRVNDHITSRATALHVADPEELTTTSTAELVNRAFEGIPRDLPEEGLGLEAVTDLLLNTIAPAMAGGQAGPRWYGLVTGGVLPAAQLADQLVTSYDPNVQVHNLEDTLTSSLTPLTMRHLLSLLRLPPSLFTQNTLTTGATSSNILGLSLGRDAVISRLKASQGVTGWSVPEDGFGGVEVDVLCAVPHASIRKAAAIAGIGRRNVLELADADSAMPCDFRMGELEERLKANWGTGRGSIVVTSAGEVNTGGWTSNHTRIRELCDLYGAWLHIDAAFGAFATLLPEFAHLAGDLALGDSITSDAHKWLNVPYDCGLFFSRGPNGLYTLCGPGGNAPAYLTASAGEGNAEFAALEEYRNAPSPLFMGIENSSRFRALPLLSSLLSLGRQGYIDLFARNISFATHITTFLRSHASYDVLLPTTSEAPDYRQMNIVLFSPSSSAPSRFQGADGSKQLVKEINGGRKMFVTGTVWRGRGAIRLAHPINNYFIGLTCGKDRSVFAGGRGGRELAHQFSLRRFYPRSRSFFHSGSTLRLSPRRVTYLTPVTLKLNDSPPLGSRKALHHSTRASIVSLPPPHRRRSFQPVSSCSLSLSLVLAQLKLAFSVISSPRPERPSSTTLSFVSATQAFASLAQLSQGASLSFIPPASLSLLSTWSFFLIVICVASF